jgi:hypothetical protein
MSRLALPSAIVLSLFAAATARADGTSKSYSDWRIKGSTAELRVSFAPHDFATAFPDLDVNRDLKIDAKELEPGKTRVGEMVVKETELFAAREKSDPKTPCQAGAPAVIPVGDPLQEVQVQVAFECASRIGALELRVHYLPTLEPPHVGVATITTPETTAQHVFTRVSPVFTLELRPASVGELLRDAMARGATRSASGLVLVVLAFLLFPLSEKRAAALFAVSAIVGAIAAAVLEASGAPIPERIAYALGALAAPIVAFIVARAAALILRRRRAHPDDRIAVIG